MKEIMDSAEERERYISQFDLVYQSPSRIWQDGFAMGNGSMGAMAYEPFHPEWSINKNNVWDYRHPESSRFNIKQVRKFVEESADPQKELAGENCPGGSLYPAPKTCGQLRIRFGFDSIYSPAHRAEKRLNLYSGTVSTKLDKHLSHPRVESFICAHEDLLIIKVKDVSAITAFHNNVDMYRPPDSLLPPCIKGAEGDTIWIEQPFHDGFKYVMMAKIVPTGTCAYSDLFKSTVQKKWWHTIKPSVNVESVIDGEYAVAPVAGDFEVYVTIVTSLDSSSPLQEARKRLQKAEQTGSATLHRQHKKWWGSFWEKNYVGLDEPLLEQMWYVSLYNMATVLTGNPVGGLCGLWYGPMDTPSQILPWRGMYTNDYNMQAPVSPVFKANHPELADGSFRTLLGQLEGARKNARELYNLPGAYYPLSADPTGEEITNPAYRFCQNSGPEWCVFLWWHYLYTRDKDYLEDVSYPIMREVAEFFANYLTWYEEEQIYRLEISQNPELLYINLADPVYTLCLLKYTISAVITASEILNRDNGLRDKCRHILEHYPAYATHGREILPLKGVRPNHINHFRTLAGLFPCGEFDPEIAPEWEESCLFEIEKADKIIRLYNCNKGALCNWSAGAYFIGTPACRLGRKDIAWRYLEDLLKCNVKPNGLITHNGVVLADSRLSEENIKNIPDGEVYNDLDPDPLKLVEILTGRLMESATDNLECKETIFPALEGPAMYLLLVGEMLLQSHNGIIRLFNGLPDKRDAEFSGLRAEGPMLVSSKIRAGEVDFIAIEALADVRFKLKSPWKCVEIWTSYCCKDGKTEKKENQQYIDIALREGEKIALSPVKENLAWKKIIKPRMGGHPEARNLTFDDGMVLWVGKPEPDIYYGTLKAARNHGLND